VRTIRVVAAVIEREGKYLITQRRASAVLPFLWEFPGGRVEDGESDAHALERELLHRLGAKVTCGKLISFVTHPYDTYAVDLFLYECALASQDTLELRNVADYRWAESSSFDQYQFTPADEASMTKLLGL
jgi:8-oxo-dGTP diphosphatase